MSLIDQVVWALARQTRAGDVVIVGLATPIAAAAALLARELLHRDITVIAGGMVDPELHDLGLAQVDPRYRPRSAGMLAHSEILDLIAAGRVNLQFLSPAQVDGRRRINTSRVPARNGGLRRLPGGLATADVAVLMGRVVAYRLAHDVRFLPDRVAFTTGAGDGDARRRYGCSGEGLTAAVTSQAVIAWRPDGPFLQSLHEGADAETARQGCGFPLASGEEPARTEPPPPEAIELLDRVLDPHGVRIIEHPVERARALRLREELAEVRGATVER